MMDVGKKTPESEPPILPSIAQAGAKCPICGSSSSGNDPDKLCWVCRRLKISAWKDSDHQLPAPE